MMMCHVQTQAVVRIPKEHHRFVLGPKGKRLNELELATATKISVPRPNDSSLDITISGTRDGIDRARHEIQLISDEQVSRRICRVFASKTCEAGWFVFDGTFNANYVISRLKTY